MPHFLTFYSANDSELNMGRTWSSSYWSIHINVSISIYIQKAYEFTYSFLPFTPPHGSLSNEFNNIIHYHVSIQQVEEKNQHEHTQRYLEITDAKLTLYSLYAALTVTLHLIVINIHIFMADTLCYDRAFYLCANHGVFYYSYCYCQYE